MEIAEDHLDQMNRLVDRGKKISQIAQKYPQYNYVEIQKQVNYSSFLGTKRKISNCLKKLIAEKSSSGRQALAKEAQKNLDELYQRLQNNNKKLVSIARVMDKLEG